MLTLSSHVYSHAPQEHIPPENPWHLPYAEIEKLVQFSEALNLQDEITPVQAWQNLKSHIKSEVLHDAVLRELKRDLARLVICYGYADHSDYKALLTIFSRFGAVLNVTQFWDSVKRVVGSRNSRHDTELHQ